jgi:hypothetical protein
MSFESPVVYLRSDIESKCELCEFNSIEDGLGEMANHYINSHGYKLSHSGTETNHNINGELWHSTVIVLAYPQLLES